MCHTTSDKFKNIVESLVLNMEIYVPTRFIVRYRNILCIEYFVTKVKIVNCWVHNQRPKNKVDWQYISGVEAGGPLSGGVKNS